MRKVFALLFVAGIVAFASCEKKAETTGNADSNTVAKDTTPVAPAPAPADSNTAAPADSNTTAPAEKK